MTTAALRIVPPVATQTTPSYHRWHAASDLLAALARAQTVGDQLAVLGRLADVGDGRALPTLRMMLASDDRRIREAAVEALSPIVDPSLPRLLSMVMMYDPAPEVRVAAIFVGMLHYLPELESTLQILTRDPEPEVRQIASAMLGMP
jgi:HEAT repeat protein